MVTPRLIWAYTYRLDPPQSAEKLSEVEAVLDAERETARARQATWEGRLITEERVGHILVLSDSPDLNREVNHRLEQALRAIDAPFALTVPMAVPTDSLQGTSPEEDP